MNNKNKINYNYSEEFITTSKKRTEEELKNLFNKKYLNLIKRIEKRNI